MARFENKYIIGLTGNIAVGKSVVRRMLQHLGAYTIDADGLSHQAMMPGAPAYKPVVDMFGHYILDPNGQVNRAKLGAIVFALPDALMTLENIVHPIVGNAVTTLINRATQRVIVIEAIKLIEGNLSLLCDAIWVVDAPMENQLYRLISERKMDEAEARKRIAAQNPQGEKLARADVIINNAGDVDATWKQVQDAWNRIPTPGSMKDPTQFLKRDTGVVKPITPPPPPPASSGVVSPPPVAPPPAAPPPAAPSKTDTQDAVVIGDLRIQRGTPNHAEKIAQFLSLNSGRAYSRMDIMLGFGQKSYHLALDSKGDVIAVAGWQVENLIASVDELYLAPDAPRSSVIAAIISEIEIAARQLQTEVCFVFLPSSGDLSIRAAFVGSGYQALQVNELTSPAWRESAGEQLKEGMTGLYKALRTDRVTRPI